MSDAPVGIKMFQVPEPDLVKLEAYLPRICDRLGATACEPSTHVILCEIREILSNIRWNYGPPTEMHIIRPKPPSIEES